MTGLYGFSYKGQFSGNALSPYSEGLVQTYILNTSVAILHTLLASVSTLRTTRVLLLN